MRVETISLGENIGEVTVKEAEGELKGAIEVTLDLKGNHAWVLHQMDSDDSQTVLLLSAAR